MLTGTRSPVHSDMKSPMAAVARSIKKDKPAWRGRQMWPREEEVRKSSDKSPSRHLSASPVGLTDSNASLASFEQMLPALPVHMTLPALPDLTYVEKLELRLQKSLNYLRGLRKEDVAAWRQHSRTWRSRTEAVRLRSEPLGSDRYHRRYWILSDDFSRIWVEKCDNTARDKVVWGSYCSMEQVDALVKALNPHGLRENALREALEIYRMVCHPLSFSPFFSLLPCSTPLSHACTDRSPENPRGRLFMGSAGQSTWRAHDLTCST